MINVVIKKAADDDAEAIWEIFREVVKAGNSYTYPPDMTREQAEEVWRRDPRKRFIARMGEKIVGFYDLRPNQRGLGSHVANAGFMVHPASQGNGIGKAMGEHALAEAKKQGYKAMQFNMVVSTNEKAIRLWKMLGFEIIGTVPKAFNHKEHGLVDSYIMHRFL